MKYHEEFEDWIEVKGEQEVFDWTCHKLALPITGQLIPITSIPFTRFMTEAGHYNPAEVLGDRQSVHIHKNFLNKASKLRVALFNPNSSKVVLHLRIRTISEVVQKTIYDHVCYVWSHYLDISQQFNIPRDVIHTEIQISFDNAPVIYIAALEEAIEGPYETVDEGGSDWQGETYDTEDHHMLYPLTTICM